MKIKRLSIVTYIRHSAVLLAFVCAAKAQFFYTTGTNSFSLTGGSTTTSTLSFVGGGTVTLSGAGTATITVPAATDTLGLLGTAQTWSAANTFSSTVTEANAVLTGSSLSATSTLSIGLAQYPTLTTTDSVPKPLTVSFSNTTGAGVGTVATLFGPTVATTGSTANALAQFETISLSATGLARFLTLNAFTLTSANVLLEGTTLTLSPFTNIYDTATTTTFNGTTLTGSAAVNLSGATTLSGITKLTNSVILGTNTFSNTATLSTMSGATFVIAGTTLSDSSTTTAISGTTLTVSTTNATLSGTVTTSGALHTTTTSIGATGTAFYGLIMASVSASSGVATVTNAALTTTTIPLWSNTAPAGTVTQSPQFTMHAGSASFAVTSGDTSTYSVVFFIK